MRFDKEALKRLAHLARIDCSEEEFEKLRLNLDSILSHIDQLEEVETRGIEEFTHVSEDQTLVMEEDRTRDLLDHSTLLSNSPDSVGGMVKVPPFLKGKDVS